MSRGTDRAHLDGHGGGDTGANAENKGGEKVKDMERACRRVIISLIHMAVAFLFLLCPVCAMYAAPPLPAAYECSTGSQRVEAANVVIDLSHTGRGYILCCYTGEVAKAAVQMEQSGSGRVYHFYLDIGGEFEAVPFLYGDGRYSIRICEQVRDTCYREVAAAGVDVALDDETLPFLYPNGSVRFRADSPAAVKGRELTRDAQTDPERIAAVYNYIIRNIAYDEEKAAAVRPGYISDPSETLTAKKGVCADYVALAAVMFRSQGIPVRVECGYMANGAYHAWISVYSRQAGAVNGLFPIREQGWSLLDPTFGAIDEARTAALLSSAGESGDYIISCVY